MNAKLETQPPLPSLSEPLGGLHLPDVVSQLGVLHTFHLFPGHGFQPSIAQADVPPCVVGRIRSEGLLWGLRLRSSFPPLTPPT